MVTDAPCAGLGVSTLLTYGPSTMAVGLSVAIATERFVVSDAVISTVPLEAEALSVTKIVLSVAKLGP